MWGKIFVGLTAYAIYKECTMTKKEKIDFAKRQALANPYLNPLGCFQHMASDCKINEDLDSPWAKEMARKYDKEYEDYCNNLSPSERVQEFYKNGGKGVNFGRMA